MEEQIQNNLSVYVTSSFALLPLTSTASIVSSIVGGVVKLPTAKFVDLIGRAEGFAIMTGFATIGTCLLHASLGYWLLIFYRFNHDGGLQECGDLCCCTSESLSSRSASYLTITGLLLGWVQWHGIRSRCLHGRYFESEKPSSCVFLREYTLYRYYIHRSTGCSIFPRN